MGLAHRRRHRGTAKAGHCTATPPFTPSRFPMRSALRILGPQNGAKNDDGGNAGGGRPEREGKIKCDDDDFDKEIRAHRAPVTKSSKTLPSSNRRRLMVLRRGAARGGKEEEFFGPPRGRKRDCAAVQ